MNKQLYIKNEKKLMELNKLFFLTQSLKSFLDENENNFKKQESIKALKKIREYLECKNKEYCNCEDQQRDINQELYLTCNHEIAIKYSNSLYYECLICNHYLDYNMNTTPQNTIFIDATNDEQVAYNVKKIFDEIVHSDKDLTETISPHLEEIQFERNIKVYRRSI